MRREVLYFADGRERRKPSGGSEPPGNLEYWVVGRGIRSGETSVGKVDLGGGRGEMDGAMLGAASLRQAAGWKGEG